MSQSIKPPRLLVIGLDGATFDLLEPMVTQGWLPNLSHVLVKVADGAFPYKVDLDSGYDYAQPAIKKLQAQNIQVWGWQYVYGDYPDQEAEIAVKRALELGVDGFVVNAEIQYENKAKATAAKKYMTILRNNLGKIPVALSSYRYPSYHINLP